MWAKCKQAACILATEERPRRRGHGGEAMEERPWRRGHGGEVTEYYIVDTSLHVQVASEYTPFTWQGVWLQLLVATALPP